ncbi:hypothetical protein MKX01_003799 [Papaver californicum]|nr:hypothetical protein MKX01_003799 [Papaver californicum]
MRINVEKSDENKVSFIFLMACFIGITSGFLIGYMTGIIDFSRLDVRRQMILSGTLISLGSVVTALTTSQFLYILGPNLFAMGFGIMYQGAQVYMSETGFVHGNYLPALNIAFKMMITIGIFVANLVNCFTNSIKGGWGWEVSIGIVVIPAAIISIVSFLLPDTPMSMIKLGKFDDAKQLLQRLIYSSKSAQGCEKQIMSQTQNRPYRVMAIALPLFQQLTGMNVIVIYAPYLFQVIGFQENAALTYTAIIGGVNVAATIIGIISVSRGCRRFFLVAGGVQICVGVTGPSDVYDYLIIATTCICVAGFAWSWGPLGWIFLFSDDMCNYYFSYSLRSVMRSKNFFKIALEFFRFHDFGIPLHGLPIQVLCLILVRFLWGDYEFSCLLFMPDSNQILVEEDVSKVWKQHWFWRRYFVDLDDDLMV